MFFLMSFLVIHGLTESPIVAGIHLAVIPIALGLVAPISGGIYRRVGARTMTTSAMGLCLGALVLLSRSLADRTASDFGVMGALMLFGAGLGMFIAPNNSATMAAAPEKLNRRGGRHAESDASPGLHDWHRGRFGCIFMASLCFDGARQQDHRRAGTSDIGGRRRSAMGPRWLCRRGGELCSLARLRHPPCLERVR
jgi:MFS family permease